MKRYTVFLVAALSIFVTLALVANIAIYNSINDNSGKPYAVEANRILALLEQGRALEDIDLTTYPHITRISVLPAGATAAERTGFFNDEVSLIRLLERDGSYVSFSYRSEIAPAALQILSVLNAILFVVLAFLVILLLYLRQQLIKPFETFSALPAKLARGDLDEPLLQQKSRFFGRFMWGLDNLRESLAHQRRQALELERERKTLNLALSHDIKTPIAAIRLYATALRDGIFVEPHKREEALGGIIRKTYEVEEYLNQMVRSSSEDFLVIEVHNGEFYLDDLLNALRERYAEKLELLGVELVFAEHADSIVSGDAERTLEALENIVENALKYGDGSSIRLRFVEEDGALLILVSNTGNRLPAQETVHIFESFWRGSNAQGQSGNGLGLFIVRQIMHQMDGDVYATVEGDTIEIVLVLKLP